MTARSVGIVSVSDPYWRPVKVVSSGCSQLRVRWFLEQRDDTVAMHFPGERDPGHLKEGGDQVGPADGALQTAFVGRSLGHGDDQGAANGSIVGGYLGS